MEFLFVNLTCQNDNRALHSRAHSFQKRRLSSEKRLEIPKLRSDTLTMRNRLRVLRAERDWSQADLAERLSVSRQTINAIETGRNDPSLPLAFKTARLFGALIEEIFVPDGQPWPPSFGS